MPTIPGLKVLRRLGRGGMSDVYEAEDPAGSHVAVKVFRNEKGSRFLEERFKAEARLLGTLFHPRIALSANIAQKVRPSVQCLFYHTRLDATRW